MNFRRIGTVIAERRPEPWTWTTRSGQPMQANAGDWAVRDAGGGDSWSVRDDIFRDSYEHTDGNRWRSRGIVQARRAHDGETLATLEGPARATSGDWVVRGEQGEQWPVPDDEFRQRYQGPIAPAELPESG
jgi:hypothetical protein